MNPLRLAIGALLLSPLVFGCQVKPRSEMPSLYPVHGIVTKEGKPIKEAFVQFVPESGESEWTINALTDTDGKYQLATLHVRSNEKKPGAPEGTYTVSVMMPLDAQQRGGEQYHLSDKYQVKPGPNDLPLEIYPKKK